MKKTNMAAIARTFDLLNYAANNCNNLNFNAKSLAPKFKTSNNTFYAALKLGYFSKNENGYKCNIQEFKINDCVKILKCNRKHVSNSLKNKPQKPLLIFKNQPVIKKQIKHYKKNNFIFKLWHTILLVSASIIITFILTYLNR